MANNGYLFAVRLHDLLYAPITLDASDDLVRKRQLAPTTTTLHDLVHLLQPKPLTFPFASVADLKDAFNIRSYLSGRIVWHRPLLSGMVDVYQARHAYVLFDDLKTLAQHIPTHFARFHTPVPHLADTVRDFETMDDSDQHIMQEYHQEAFRQAAVLEPYGVAATALMLPQWEWFTRDEIPLLKQAYDAIKDNPQWVDGVPFLKDPDAFADLFAYDEPYDLIGSAW